MGSRGRKQIERVLQPLENCSSLKSVGKSEISSRLSLVQDLAGILNDGDYRGCLEEFLEHIKLGKDIVRSLLKDIEGVF
jgi:hypothetical protein